MTQPQMESPSSRFSKRALSGLRGLIPSIASGGELAAVRLAARAALDRLRSAGAAPLPGLSAATLLAGRTTRQHPPFLGAGGIKGLS